MKPQLRGWRIALVGDVGPHKTDNVFRLCWQRGYVVMVHGGGQTPVTQTPDTDVSQHVRREHTSSEYDYIIEQIGGRRVGAEEPTKHNAWT